MSHPSRLRAPLARSTLVHTGVRIAVIISLTTLFRIFQYGFTTREEGHGFGLHSSALAAQELGGSLSVHSNGPGHGATFRLELPYIPAQEAA